MLFNFALEYDTRKALEYQMRLELNGAHLFLSYADDVNLLGDNIYAVNNNRETSIEARKEVGLEINVEKTKYMLVFRHQKTCKIRDTKLEKRR
jgi:hypothetical protein